MKAGELIRAIVIVLVGIALMLGLQPWLFVSETIFLADVDLREWVPRYAIGTWIVMGTTLLVTLIWFLVTSFYKSRGGHADPIWRVWWFVLLFFPVIAICIALYFFNPNPQAPSRDALLWLAIFYPLDVLWIYWFSTVTSTPRMFKYMPPLGLPIRQLIP